MMNILPACKFQIKRQLSFIDEEQDDDESQIIRISKFQTSPKMTQQTLQQQKYGHKSNGLDSFMNFLNKSQNTSAKKLKPLPKQHKITDQDDFNPENQIRPRPNSPMQRNSLNKFTDFLKDQDKNEQEKIKKKKNMKVNGLDKFLKTLDAAESLKQQRKMSNIVSGILGLSESLPKNPKIHQKYRYLINEQKFAQIRSKSKQLKQERLKKRSHSAKLFYKQTKTQNIPQNLQKRLYEKNAFERKLKFFQNINDTKLFQLKLTKTSKKDFVFINWPKLY